MERAMRFEKPKKWQISEDFGDPLEQNCIVFAFFLSLDLE